MDYNTIRIFLYCIAAMIGVWLMYLGMRARKILLYSKNKKDGKEQK